MAATGPNPVSVRIEYPFNSWAPTTAGLLEAEGNYAPNTATVHVEVRYEDPTSPTGNSVLTGTALPKPVGTWKFQFDPATVANFPNNAFVDVVAFARTMGYRDLGEDSCSVLVNGLTISSKKKRSAGYKSKSSTKKAPKKVTKKK